MADEGSDVGLWENILKDVDTESRTADKTMFLLGRPGIGKRTLVHSLLSYACPAAMHGDVAAEISLESHSRAVGLDYSYFGCRDPEQDEAAQAPDYVCPAACSVLVLEDVKHEKLLRSRLSCESLKNSAAMICLDLKNPWTMLEDLRQWLDLLQKLTSELIQQLPLGAQDELREKVTSALEYDPGEENNLENSDGTALVYNMGIPIVVVVTRSDGAAALETQKTMNWSETIEAHVRNECLSYGAALVYTMVQAKNTTNVNVLFDYLMHRLYGYPLKLKPITPSRDALFLPSGWDTQAKVDEAASRLPSGGLDRSFESVVVPLDPPSNTAQQPPVECEDMQAFLKRNVAVLSRLGGGSANAARKTGVQASEAAIAAGDRRPSGGAPRRSLRDQTGAGAVPDNNDLKNYFQSLLTRGPAATGAAVTGAAGTTDAVAATAAGTAATANPAAAAAPVSDPPPAPLAVTIPVEQK